MSPVQTNMPRTTTQPKTMRFDWRGALGLLGPTIALALLVTVTSIYSPEFLKIGNIMNVLRQAAPWGVVAIGMTFVIISGGIDLSVGALAALAAGVGIFAMNAMHAAEMSPAASIAVTVLVMIALGTALGAINGALVTLGRLAPFVATLATLAIYRSFILAQAQGGAISGKVSDFTLLASRGVPLLANEKGVVTVFLSYPIIIFFVVAVLAAALLRFTTFGLHVRAVGGNEKAAQYAAVRVGRTRFLVYTLAGLTCGIGAVINGARQNSISTPSFGLFWELDAIAAVVIGGTALAGGSGRVFGTVVGVLILAVINNMLSLWGVGTHYQGMVKGGIILTAVLLQRAGRT